MENVFKFHHQLKIVKLKILNKFVYNVNLNLYYQLIKKFVMKIQKKLIVQLIKTLNVTLVNLVTFTIKIPTYKIF